LLLHLWQVWSRVRGWLKFAGELYGPGGLSRYGLDSTAAQVGDAAGWSLPLKGLLPSLQECLMVPAALHKLPHSCIQLLTQMHGSAPGMDASAWLNQAA
jgi:hypothetical protein